MHSGAVRAKIQPTISICCHGPRQKNDSVEHEGRGADGGAERAGRRDGRGNQPLSGAPAGRGPAGGDHPDLPAGAGPPVPKPPGGQG